MESTINKRLKEIRKSLNLNQGEMAKLLDCTQALISAFEKGKATPSVEKLLNIKTACNVDVNWLLTGQGSMFVGEENKNGVQKRLDAEKKISELKAENSILKKDLERLDNYNQELNEEIKEKFRRIIGLQDKLLKT